MSFIWQVVLADVSQKGSFGLEVTDTYATKNKQPIGLCVYVCLCVRMRRGSNHASVTNSELDCSAVFQDGGFAQQVARRTSPSRTSLS
jgi:hypothetical protein